MEMNTRLQVEHPVTEMITGQDLVEWQLRIAGGEPLPLAQDELQLRGHAFEARVYAEDPDNDFLPATGTLGFLRAPAESRHVRVDTGVREGDEISVYYDPMIAKLIVWDESRERALQRLATALSEYRIGGTTTNLDFLYNLATSAPFIRAQLDTGFIEQHRDQLFRASAAELARDLPRAALALLLHRGGQAQGNAGDPHSPWEATDAWRLNEPHLHRFALHCHGADHLVTLEARGGAYRIAGQGFDTVLAGEFSGDRVLFEEAGHRQRGVLAEADGQFTLYLPEGACHFHVVPPDTGESEAGVAGNALAAPMNGTVVALLVEPGSPVEAATPLLVMEAMKMEHTLKAPTAGTVRGYRCAAGELVDGGAELVDFEQNDGAAAS
jgi:3-methylcrotonyl-CoA carboxylase alpha subunit